MYTKEEIISKLREELHQIKQVKDNEVLVNKEYKEIINNLEIKISLLNEIIDRQTMQIVKLENKLKEIIVK